MPAELFGSMQSSTRGYSLLNGAVLGPENLAVVGPMDIQTPLTYIRNTQ